MENIPKINSPLSYFLVKPHTDDQTSFRIVLEYFFVFWMQLVQVTVEEFGPGNYLFRDTKTQHFCREGAAVLFGKRD